mgnify:FL=1
MGDCALAVPAKAVSLTVRLSPDRQGLKVSLSGTPPSRQLGQLIRQYRPMFSTVLTRQLPSPLPKLSGDPTDDFTALAALEVYMAAYQRSSPVSNTSPESSSGRLRPIETVEAWKDMITELVAAGAWRQMLYTLATSPPGPTRTENIGLLLEIAQSWTVPLSAPTDSLGQPAAIRVEPVNGQVVCRYRGIPPSPVIDGWVWQNEHVFERALANGVPQH